MLRGRDGDGDSSDGDRVGWGQRLWGWGGDGSCVHGDGRGWGSVSVPMQTSSLEYIYDVEACNERHYRERQTCRRNIPRSEYSIAP